VAPTNSTTHILNLDRATLAFSGGNLAADFSNAIALGLYSKVTNLSRNSLYLSFTLSSGAFSGKVTDPYSGKSLPFSGAVFQKLNTGGGLLLGANKSSSLLLTQ
jgi:hypothetical protein